MGYSKDLHTTDLGQVKLLPDIAAIQLDGNKQCYHLAQKNLLQFKLLCCGF